MSSISFAFIGKVVTLKIFFFFLQEILEEENKKLKSHIHHLAEVSN